MAFSLSPPEVSLLREVRASDEDHGGLNGEELDSDELETMGKLCELGLVEAQSEYGEAPDGEEDEAAMGATALIYRITGHGVTALREVGPG